MRTIFILHTTALALIMQLLIINPALAQDTNTTSQNRNNTRLIVDLKNHTISIVDTTTNETISVKKFTPEAASNTTTNENLTMDTGNATTNEILIPEKTTINETLTMDTRNATTNESLTTKFKELQGE